MSPFRASQKGGERGQTLPDFAVGIAIFLLTIAFIFVFIPELTLPFESQEQPVVAERAATTLDNHLLATEGSPSELNETCTLAFFLDDEANCSTLPDEPVTEQLGIASVYSVNVTLRDAPSDASESMVCRADSEQTLGDCTSGDNDKALAVGPPVPEANDSVAVARRKVFVGETRAVLEIGVW